MSIFTQLSATPGTDTSGVISTEVNAGLWSPDETGSLAAIFTSSIQKDVSGEYYYDLYNLNPDITTNNAEVQFSVAYGHISGGGSPPSIISVLGGNSVLPTQVIYSQYRNILLGPGSSFTFGTVGAVNTISSDIYVINVNRARMKQSLDPGNWQLGLSGSNGLRTFIDEFGSNTVVGNTIASKAYYIRSGSIDDGIYSADTTIYGVVYPDYGTIILHPAAISSSVGLYGTVSTNLNANTSLASNVAYAPYTGSAATAYQYQHEGLVRSISGSMARGSYFYARSVEQVSSKNYTISLPYNAYNYSNNPTYYSSSADGTRRILADFRNNPITYPTTIGLYNDTNELIAVAKLSRPIQKSKDKVVYVRVRLDY